MKEYSKIVCCDACEGRGYIVVDTLIDYHRREYDYKNVSCKICEGTGRMIKEVKLVPYVPGPISN